MMFLSGIGVEVASVSLVLKESQSDAVEMKPWMTISDLYCRLTVKFIRESVDSLCRDGADAQYMQYLRKSRITSPQIC